MVEVREEIRVRIQDNYKETPSDQVQGKRDSANGSVACRTSSGVRGYKGSEE